MAQEKLLFPLIILVLITGVTSPASASVIAGTDKSSVVNAGEEFPLESFMHTKEELERMQAPYLEYALNIYEKSKKMAADAIKEQWAKLQKIRNLTPNEAQVEMSEIEDGRANLKIFISSSMNPSLLKNYIKQAKKYNATLIINGLPGGSWHKLSELVMSITDNREETFALQIDDEAFKAFDITSVPTFVFCREKGVFAADASNHRDDYIFDKVSGNITIKRALELFSDGGELSDLAEAILDRAESGEDI